MGKEPKKSRDHALGDALGDALRGDDEIDEIFNIEIKSESYKEDLDIDNADNGDSGGDGDSGFSSKEVIKLPITRAPRKIYVTIAVIMIFFSVIGVIVSVSFTRNLIIDIRDRKSLKEEFALFVYPVVINDPPAFDSVDSLRPQTIITSAIWKIILTGNMNNYTSEMGATFIPAADVELSARSIFGVGISEDKHTTVVTHGIQFIYSAQDKRYEIPANPSLFSNSPLVTDITNIGEVYTVTIDYIAPSPLRVAGIEQNNEPIKTMIYTITRTREKMTINAIKSADFQHAFGPIGDN